ncbi:MAG: tRNA preQ1(34) S-adenosylmethionine ribosyltransferase-isomerase QueA [Magnetococcales bacterium]|nr:tRNA preQ1(34) S-adenosylmethionine ribosyltransferase-isomerase QueA [Magnetococcales bacterium]
MDSWRLSDFDYPLPPERIAQRPVWPRDASRLLVSRPDGITDGHFTDLAAWLRAGDLLVVNDTRVIKARLMGRKESGGRVELFLLRPLEETGVWEALTGSNRPVRVGGRVVLGNDFSAEILARDGERCRVRLHTPDGDVTAALERFGRTPLPPYIVASDPDEDRERYQTVYAARPGAVAAPTAGLHFTEGLLAALEARGVETAKITLHVGPGTFQPVREENPAHHVMHREWFSLSGATAERINATRARGGRVVAVGTTVVRTLESVADEAGVVRPTEGETALFILPGFRFRVVDLMITNFHLPKSSLLMLVAAFVGIHRQQRDYAHAVTAGYRFYSYGDANLLFPEHGEGL